MALVLMLLMTATNLFSVTSYGEFEYWFAGVKVVTIALFIALGTLFVLGLWPGRDLDFSNLTAHGGFLPNGVGALFSGIVIVVFSMVGAEIATVAAAESAEPERAIVKATNSVVLRVTVFFVGSIFLLATILPWNSTELGDSPYVSAMEEIGIPAAAEIMNAVVLTAVLSCLNSGLYTASRMLFVLAARREAPTRMLAISRRGVPTWSIISSSLVGFACVIAAYISPDQVFLFLLNSSGAIILFVYLLISVSQLRLRRMTPPEQLKIKMWFYPVLTMLTAAAIVAVLVSMFVRGDTRSQILLSLLAWGVVLVAFAVNRRAIGDAHLTESGIAAEERADTWMHEHGPAAELEVDAVVGEGPLDRELIRRVREEGYANEGM
jgi:GABA permease